MPKRSTAKKKPKRHDSEAPPALRTVAQPKQARAEETLERLLDAAEQLIRHQGLAQVSIAAIASAAGSSVGGFYARFKDKDELLRTLHEREQRRFQSSLEQVTDPALWAEQPLATMIERALQLFFARLEGRQKLAAAFLESAARRPERWRHAVEFRTMVVDAFVELLALRGHEIRHPEPEVAIRFAIYQVLATVDQRALFAHVGSPGGSEMVNDQVRIELTRSLCRYLGVEAPDLAV